MTQAKPPEILRHQPEDARSLDPVRRPVPPEQSREDTDAGWGEQPDPDDTERLRRELPPHWS